MGRNAKGTKGINIKIGADTSNLQDALKSVNTKSKSLQKELTTGWLISYQGNQQKPLPPL